MGRSPVIFVLSSSVLNVEGFFFLNSAVIAEGKLRQRDGFYTWTKTASVSAEISVLLGWLHRKPELYSS